MSKKWYSQPGFRENGHSWFSAGFSKLKKLTGVVASKLEIKIPKPKVSTIEETVYRRLLRQEDRLRNKKYK